MFYRIVENKLSDYADYKYAQDCKETDIITMAELDEDPLKVVVNDKGILILNPNYEHDKEQQEKERISRLSLTRREVFLALYKDKEITPEMIRAQITNPENLIEFDYAEKYYRFNPLIDSIGGMLGYTSEDLDYLFMYKKFPLKVESE